MFHKRKLKKQIRESQSQIEQLESKRNRSQAAIVEALMNKQEPDAEDVRHFQMYTGMIDQERSRLRKLISELDA